jgi:putative ABC transport system permease protein
MLAKNPGFTAVAVLTLALGIGANAAIFNVVNAVLLRSLPYRDPSRLVMIWETYPQFPKVWASVPNMIDWREQNDVFDAIGAYRVAGRGFTLTGRGEPERIQGTFTSANLFSLLGVKASLGRIFLAAEDKPGEEPVVILSHSLWQRLFGSDPVIIGRTVTLNDKNYAVIGIMPSDFQFPHWAELWMPLGQMGTDELTNRVYHPLEVVARLKPSVTLAEAETQIRTIAQRLDREYPKTNGGWGVRLVPLRQEIVGSVRGALLILFGATGLVLLIACANLGNLLLARAATRRKEIALRVAVGASRSRLIRQLLTESVLLSFLGGGLGSLLAFWGRGLLLAMAPPVIGRMTNFRVDGPMLGFAAMLSILTGLVFGLLPAFRSSTLHLNEALKESARTSSATPRRNRLSSSFVVFQVALALVLLVGAGLLVKSFVRLLGVDPGFNPNHVLTARIDLPESRYPHPEQFYQQVSKRLKILPGVEAVGLVNYLPFSPESANKTRFIVEGSSPSDTGTLPGAELRSVNSDYFHAMGIPLVKGRNFASWGEEKQPVIINEMMARRFFPHEDPIGKRINLGPEESQPYWFSIVGVAGDVRDFGLADQPRLDIYVDEPGSGMYLVVRGASDPLSLSSSVRRAVAAVDREVPFTQEMSLEQIVSDSLASRRFSMALLGLFATLAFALAAIGIYGLVSYSVTQRTHEIGVRMALGAERRDVLRLVVGQGMVLVLFGVSFGITLALGLTRLMASLLYEVRSTDPVTFAGVSLLLSAVALFACYIPARRATKVDPMVALRYE